MIQKATGVASALLKLMVLKNCVLIGSVCIRNSDRFT